MVYKSGKGLGRGVAKRTLFSFLKGNFLSFYFTGRLTFSQESIRYGDSRLMIFIGELNATGR